MEHRQEKQQKTRVSYHQKMQQLLKQQQEPEVSDASTMREVHQTRLLAEEETVAHMSNLQDYMELLYEDVLARKVSATDSLQQLFRDTKNIIELAAESALLASLARTLREEGRKSIDLATNIISCFWALTNFSQFHQLVIEQNVGAATIDLIVLEIQRTESRQQEDGVSPAIVAKGALEEQKAAQEGREAQISSKQAKYSVLVQKQDQFLYWSFYLLFNLAEDPAIERKMWKKNIVVRNVEELTKVLLVKMLDRSSMELSILAVTFLKKLSIYQEAKDKMLQCNIVQLLSKKIQFNSDHLVMAILWLLHNLAFDEAARSDIAECGLIPALAKQLNNKSRQSVVLVLLYLMSMDDKHREAIGFAGNVLGTIFKHIMLTSDLWSSSALIALGVNLAQNPRNAEILTEEDRFGQLMQKALVGTDDLVFKLLRNCSQQDIPSIKEKFIPYIDQMVQCLTDEHVPVEVHVEILGCLANLNIPGINYLQIINNHNLLDWMAKFIQPYSHDDDIALEVVMFVGVMCNEETAPLIAESGLVDLIFGLLSDKKNDEEFVLQIAFTFQRLLMYPKTREALLNTEAIICLVDMLSNNNSQVRNTADAGLDYVMEVSDEWRERLRHIKFEQHNRVWIERVKGKDITDMVL